MKKTLAIALALSVVHSAAHAQRRDFTLDTRTISPDIADGRVRVTIYVPFEYENLHPHVRSVRCSCVFAGEDRARANQLAIVYSTFDLPPVDPAVIEAGEGFRSASHTFPMTADLSAFEATRLGSYTCNITLLPRPSLTEPSGGGEDMFALTSLAGADADPAPYWAAGEVLRPPLSSGERFIVEGYFIRPEE